MKWLLLATVAAKVSWFPLPDGFDQSKPDEILPLIQRDAEAKREEIPFQAVYVFGDSCCDTGNQFAQSKQTMPNPKFYWRGRFSNGPIWPDYLQVQNNVNMINYAHGGATINSANFNHGDDVPDFERQFVSFKNSQRLPGPKQVALIDFVGNDLLGKQVSAAGVAADMERVMQRMVDETDLRNFLVMLTPVEDYHRLGFNYAIKAMVERFTVKNRPLNVHAYSLPLMDFYTRLRTTVPPRLKYWKSGSCFNQFTGLMCPDPGNHFKYDLYHIGTLANHATANYIASEIRARWNP
ncbi:hypothetical protein DSO57_1029210 [Entomophthora muscae]|uniref:Uncharacterized protein n=2 Tax=Entomophthora muscae TaxID=34485 RepID=A0ACC2RDH3_9FUNG|nr:hypothetical protein DSO57_1038178 [Entomophthora muscae]KAJ9072284.1 hypothetical protein DSO57_1029210 [Entomophthora muscae]